LLQLQEHQSLTQSAQLALEELIQVQAGQVALLHSQVQHLPQAVTVAHTLEQAQQAFKVVLQPILVLVALMAVHHKMVAQVEQVQSRSNTGATKCHTQSLKITKS
jgi:hypothetical protein